MFTGCLGVSVSRSKTSVPEILSEEIDVIDPVADTEENADIISVSSKVLCMHEAAYSVERWSEDAKARTQKAEEHRAVSCLCNETG